MPKSNTAIETVASETVTIDRRRQERREEETNSAAPEVRRKTQRRRQIDPTTCERDYNEQEIEFMHAMDEYKRAAGRMFPTCSEVLEVIRSLGYVQLNEDQRAQLAWDESDTVEPYTNSQDEEDFDCEDE
ncbi:hypothetical protein FF011L_42650 [Roseimaritima multifibrata]|uniref:Uncharacterized protein n=1 Tax=Roseimaritima multifibrata TaxID=1930274 RepID=A0A517MKQ7_9BACT|nr:hypothetical protein [Roseimaritima multifibrata]QDS95469.1 hypothetical protein FF011L_42650 [Roseimaritima multifibrata]